MLKIDELYDVLDSIAPFELSQKCIEKGDYDNSGIIIRSHQEVNKIFFALDLSIDSVKRAKRERADTIVTHHPAIYYPIKNLSIDDPSTAPVLMAMENKMNVISLHLNLDTANGGIDHCLAIGLGAKDFSVLDDMGDGNGYGRTFYIEKTSFGEFLKKIKSVFGTDKIIAYGSKTNEIESIASFCGAGSSHALEFINKGLQAEVIVTSDMPHHVIKELIERGKKIVLLPHYVAEEYGFNVFSKRVQEKLNSTNVVYFDDKRFR